MSEEQDGMSGATVGATTGVEELLQVHLEDRRARERENEQLMKVMCEHMDSLMRLVETSHRTGGPPGAATALTPSNPEVWLSKLTSSVNIEVYLLTFERMMISYGVEKAHWVVRLVPQLSGKAQQAFVAMPTAEAGGQGRNIEAVRHQRRNVLAEISPSNPERGRVVPRAGCETNRSLQKMD